MRHVFQYAFLNHAFQSCLNCGEELTVEATPEQCPGRQHVLPDNTPEDDWRKDR